MSEPTVDNCDGETTYNESLKDALRSLTEDWPTTFTILAAPSEEHVKRIATEALERINKLERMYDELAVSYSRLIMMK